MVLTTLGTFDALHIWIRFLIYLAASILCVGGVFLIGEPSPTRPALQDEATTAAKSDGLGTFYLNGHSFTPYEKEMDDGGRQFRLLSHPSVNPEQEAAIIRYMVHEGLIEEMWPQLTQKIQSEANWAFFS